jgi:DNA polymerase III delta prime subunit
MSWFLPRTKGSASSAELDEAARAHLDAELEHLRVALNVAARRLDRVGLLPGRGAALPDPFARVPDPDPLELEAIDDASRRRDALTERLTRDQLEPPLARLARRLELDEDDRLLVIVALANELAPDFRTLFALFDAKNREVPTLATILFALVPAVRWSSVRQRLDPDLPLVRYGLVSNADHEPPSLHDTLRPTLRLLRYTSGELGLDPALSTRAQLFRADAKTLTRIELPGDGERFARLSVGLERAPHIDQLPLLIVRGTTGSGRARFVRELAARRGQATLVVELVSPDTFEDELDAGLREARLHDAVLALRGYAELDTSAPTSEDAPPRPRRDHSLTLARALAGHPSAVALLVPADFDQLPTLRRPLELVDMAAPDPPATEALWRQYLPLALTDGLTAPALAAAFRATPGEIEAVSGEALRAMTLSAKPIDHNGLRSLIKEARRHRLRDIATLVTRGYGWNDLVAPRELTAQLDELISRYGKRRQVMETWGLSARFGEAAGISALFEGPPGTGKTMAASIVAQELGLDLFQVDLSKVMSKWVGETEKHLATLFDEAERAHALILFDEADSLFARRTEVKDSHDRSANLKVNYLLQRIERFSGIAVLTTNLPENFDEALARRVSVRVVFPRPDAALRRTLWASMLAGSSLPTRLDASELDTLAEAFELSGGLIRNAVLRAAYMAAARDIAVDYALLEIAARIEQKHQHMLMRGDPMRELVERYPSHRS